MLSEPNEKLRLQLVPKKKPEARDLENSKRFREKVREQMDDTHGRPKDADDAIDEMVSRSVKRHGP